MLVVLNTDKQTQRLSLPALSGKRWLSETQSLSASLYHRQSRTRTLNGDLNNDYEDDPTQPGGAQSAWSRHPVCRRWHLPSK